jgi:hypothetical protein
MENRKNALYNYLLEKGDTWTPQVQVARDLFEHYGNGECCLAPEEYHDSTERKNLSKEISEINASPDFEKIIISSGKGIKLANEKEHYKYLSNQYKAIFRKLKRVRIMEKKAGAHNQIGIDGKTIVAFLENVDKNY